MHEAGAEQQLVRWRRVGRRAQTNAKQVRRASHASISSSVGNYVLAAASTSQSTSGGETSSHENV